ncbi:TlpA family protein disulfide reductase [Cohnella cholangitidis]|uniref:TlpA family protein disulfide reductase n=1 Tax=Cohnella cholangitidis TaxID=2598458 RepID=A0A7G5C1H4_9BACL|nr:TlpA disulfide reductase family protein [Cohnella cholangitidis]QMV43058.1 TlpA family protein disulfide reductase [Cohnella cholangitidis]
MKNWRNWLILIAVALLTGLVLLQQLNGNRKGASANSAALIEAANIPEKPQIGFTAPSFSLTGTDGKIYDLKKLRGKPVILNFWASWCGPCKDEAPSFVKLDKQYGDRLQIIAVNLTATDSVQSAREFAQNYGFKFPVVFDTDGQVGAKYEIRPIPSTMFIDSDGIITDGVLGALAWDDLKSRSLALLEPAEPEN